MADESIDNGTEVELDDDLAVEIVDDMPKEDQNRKPLPAALARTLEDDEEELEGDVEEVRRKAAERIKLARKAWNDERRDKEEALRLADEATKVAKSYQQRVLSQQDQLQTGEGYLISQMQDKVKKEVSMAKAAYKAAYESGDSDALAEAQEVLNRATNNAMQVEQWKPTQKSALQLQEELVQIPTQAARQPESKPAFDSKAQAWASKNAWYGTDDEMTSLALGVHQKLVKDGVDPTSDEYYARIDRRMREVYPDQFETQKPSATVVAAVQRTARGSRKITLTQTQASLAKRLGLTNEQYARELIKTREQANG